MAKISITSILLSDNWADLLSEIYPGCDLEFWAAHRAQSLKETQSPRRKPRNSTPRRPSGKPRAKFNYATQALSGAELQTSRRAAATAELVERVNNPTDDPVTPDPQGGYLVLVNGEPTIWADTPTPTTTALRSYEDYYTPRPIIWCVAGQEIDLEAEL